MGGESSLVASNGAKMTIEIDVRLLNRINECEEMTCYSVSWRPIQQNIFKTSYVQTTDCLDVCIKRLKRMEELGFITRMDDEWHLTEQGKSFILHSS